MGLTTSNTQPAAQASRGRMGKLISKIGLYNLITLGIAVFALWGFAALASEVFEGEFTNMNRSIMLAIHSHGSHSLDSLAIFVTNIGSTVICGSLALLLAAYWFYKKETLEAYTLVIVLGGGAVLTYVLKQFFQEPRPTIFTPLVIEKDYGFPSGHALIAFCFYGFIAVRLLWHEKMTREQRTPLRILGAIAAILFAGCIALSRVYLGVHYPTDILAGMLVAMFWLGACFFSRKWYEDHFMEKKALV